MHRILLTLSPLSLALLLSLCGVGSDPTEEGKAAQSVPCSGGRLEKIAAVKYCVIGDRVQAIPKRMQQLCVAQKAFAGDETLYNDCAKDAWPIPLVTKVTPDDGNGCPPGLALTDDKLCVTGVSDNRLVYPHVPAGGGR